MKKGVLQCLFASLFLFTSVSLQASPLQACDTSECVKLFKSYRILSKQGHSTVMAILGELSATGYGTEKPRKALKWFKRAGKYGIYDAINFANDLYQDSSTKQLQLTQRYKQVDATINEQIAQLQFPKGEMGTITTTMETFEHVFNAHTTLLTASIPDITAGTGSYIASQTCAHMVACTSVKKEFLQDAIIDANWTSK